MKGISPLIVIVIAIAILGAFTLFLTSDGLKLPFATVSFNEFSSCRIGEPEFLTISCKRSGFPITDKITLVAGQDVTAKIRLAEAKISYVTPNLLVTIKDSSSGQIICSSSAMCIDKPLTIGRTYSFFFNCAFFCPSDARIEWSGQAINLKLTIGQIGISEVDMPATVNCISNDMARDSALIGKADEIDSSVPRAISLELDQAKEYPRGTYREIPPLITTNINGQAGVCNLVDKKIYGFSKATALDGTCWGLFDKSIVLLDGTQKKYFVCSPEQCQTVHGLGSAYTMVNNECVQTETPQVQCITQQDCGNMQFIENADGTVVKRDFACVLGSCTQKDTSVACTPTRAYSNNQCCVRDILDNYKLEACRTALQSCDILGADACCTATQPQYTYKPEPEGTFCCDPNADGIGKVTSSKATCEGADDKCGFLGLGCFFDNLINALIWIGVFIIAIIVLLIIWKLVSR